ncbi:hypothetical protein QBC37DRAFT_425810 [Rhypophila decipiens]|uniref:Uncharacterized protein n=1 Tax=Rhypophila decipiens TaxID=261697 RepID=A0AAN6Y8G4_9PEZI|nr:hypothetical protein QBC37DRAFT_425810 [Rhypophila decipiens]
MASPFHEKLWVPCRLDCHRQGSLPGVQHRERMEERILLQSFYLFGTGSISTFPLFFFLALPFWSLSVFLSCLLFFPLLCSSPHLTFFSPFLPPTFPPPPPPLPFSFYRDLLSAHSTERPDRKVSLDQPHPPLRKPILGN